MSFMGASAHHFADRRHWHVEHSEGAEVHPFPSEHGPSPATSRGHWAASAVHAPAAQVTSHGHAEWQSTAAQLPDPEHWIWHAWPVHEAAAHVVGEAQRMEHGPSVHATSKHAPSAPQVIEQNPSQVSFAQVLAPSQMTSTPAVPALTMVSWQPVPSHQTWHLPSPGGQVMVPTLGAAPQLCWPLQVTSQLDAPEQSTPPRQASSLHSTRHDMESGQ